MKKDSLQQRKQHLVRDAIYEAAIGLFAAQGFDETTVEEVAEEAGVSRRSFFRYFNSKDDLLAQNLVQYGHLLTAAIKRFPPAMSPFEVVRGTVLDVVGKTVTHAHTRQVLEISLRSASARQAQFSRLKEVEDAVARAFAARLKSRSEDEVKPRLLASLTLSVMNVATMSWYRGAHKELDSAAHQVFAALAQFVGEQPDPVRRQAKRKT